MGQRFGNFEPSQKTHVAGGKMLEVVFSIDRCYPDGTAHDRLLPRLGHRNRAAGFCWAAETAGNAVKGR